VWTRSASRHFCFLLCQFLLFPRLRPCPIACAARTVVYLKRLPWLAGQNVTGCCTPVAGNVTPLIPDYQRCNGCNTLLDFIYDLPILCVLASHGMPGFGRPRPRSRPRTHPVRRPWSPVPRHSSLVIHHSSAHCGTLRPRASAVHHWCRSSAFHLFPLIPPLSTAFHLYPPVQK
jgi:hypothetical protein